MGIGLYSTVVCSHCSEEIQKQNRHINYAKKRGSNLYCDAKCAGQAKRGSKITDEAKWLKNRVYYAEYYRLNRSTILAKRKETRKRKQTVAQAPQLIIDSPLPQGVALGGESDYKQI